MLFCQRDHLVFEFIQPIFKQDQESGSATANIAGMRPPVHQLMTHCVIDTFVQAFRQSEVDHAGHLVIAGAA